MLKAITGTTLVLGITENNVQRMKKDEPVKVSLKEMGLDGSRVKEIVIFYGKDDQDLFNQIKPGIDPLKTIFHSDQADNN